jgi:hypothetical protein
MSFSQIIIGVDVSLSMTCPVCLVFVFVFHRLYESYRIKFSVGPFLGRGNVNSKEPCTSCI